MRKNPRLEKLKVYEKEVKKGLENYRIICTPALCAHDPSYPATHTNEKLNCLPEPATLHSWFIEHFQSTVSLPNIILSTSVLSGFFSHCQLLLC